MLGFGFLNPMLLWALPIAAVPIVIHLLNRRRYQRRPWAAMTFLLAALARNRRRLLMEQWLLLLLRVLAVLLLVFAVARPQWAGTILGERRTHHVVCLDDSASMAQRVGAGNAMQRAVAAVTALAEGFGENRTGDLWTLLLASAPDRPQQVALPIDRGLGARVREQLATVAVGDGELELGGLLRAAVAQAAATPDARRTRIHVVTDFRAVDWLDAEGRARNDVAAVLAQLDPQEQRVEVLVVGERTAENVGIVDVRPLDRTLVAGVPLELAVDVHNFGSDTSNASELAVEVDGRAQNVQPLPPLASGETRTLTLRHTFATEGGHGLVARLPVDRFPVDDARALALPVVEHSRVLLVDGAPGDAPEDSETFFLTAAFAPGGDARSGIAPTVIRDHQLGETQLGDFDLVVLCNVAAPGEAVVGKLEEYVRAGGGMVWFLGDQVDPGTYTARLWRGGAGLLPAPLGELAGDMDAPLSVHLGDRDHRIFVGAQDLLEQWFARVVLVGRWFTLAADPGEGARTLLRVHDPGGAPLMLVRQFHGADDEPAGEVALITTTADIAWTNWPATPALLVVAHETHRALGRRHDPRPYNHGPLGTHELTLDLARLRPDVIVRGVGPDPVVRTFTATIEGDGTGDARLAIPMRELSGFGLFELELTPHAGTPERRVLARLPPLAESRLAPMTRTLLQQTYPEPARAVLDVHESDELRGAALAGAQSDLWRVFGLALVAALALESLLSGFWLTRRRVA